MAAGRAGTLTIAVGAPFQCVVPAFPTAQVNAWLGQASWAKEVCVKEVAELTDDIEQRQGSRDWKVRPTV